MMQTITVKFAPERWKIARLALVAGLSLVISLAIPAPACAAAAAAAPENAATAWEHLREADLRAASIIYRLAVANAALCDRKMPATGLVLHSIGQYAARQRESARLAFRFEAPLSVEAAVADSPSARAGIRANDAIIAIGGSAIPPEPQTAEPSSALRDGAERQLAALPEREAIRIELIRNGRPLQIELLPVPACRTRFELLTGRSREARSDGETIQLSSWFLERFDDSGLAVVLAHELAHTVLHHREKLAAAHVSKGVMGEIGRSAKLNRQAEDEADRLSIHLLRNAGFDPAIAAQFWRGSGRVLGGGLFRGGSHASASERARMLERETNYQNERK